MKIEIKYHDANFRVIPPSKKNPDRSPLGVIEFMGGSQMVVNDALFPETEAADEILCSASYMAQTLRVDQVLDIRKSGKSVGKAVLSK